MSKHNTICSAKCHYYRADERHEIFCAGLKIGMGTHVAFASPAERKLWRDSYCKSVQGYEKCPVREMLEKAGDGGACGGKCLRWIFRKAATEGAKGIYLGRDRSHEVRLLVF